jgi:hypothetical protein
MDEKSDEVARDREKWEVYLESSEWHKDMAAKLQGLFEDDENMRRRAEFTFHGNESVRLAILAVVEQGRPTILTDLRNDLVWPKDRIISKLRKDADACYQQTGKLTIDDYGQYVRLNERARTLTDIADFLQEVLR